MNVSQKKSQSGFTLVELLVVIAIIGILIALFLPAIQAARESARRTQCANNLKQMGLALQNFESTFQHFPSSWKGIGPIGTPNNDGWSAQAQLLPYIEESNLHDKIDFRQGYNAPIHQAVHVSGRIQRLAAIKIPTFLCPNEIENRLRTKNDLPYHYPLNYGANLGVWFVFDPISGRGGNGSFFPNSRLKTGAYKDGLSNTIAFAEVRAFQPYFRNAAIPDPMMPMFPSEICDLRGDFKQNSGHTEWVDGRCHQSGFTTTFLPNTRIVCSQTGLEFDVDWTNIQEGKSTDIRTFATVTARSYHPAGLNVSRMDGSVQFVGNEIDLELWRSLSTRNGSEILNDSEN